MQYHQEQPQQHQFYEHHHHHEQQQDVTMNSSSSYGVVPASPQPSSSASTAVATSNLIAACTYNNAGASSLERGNLTSAAEALVEALQHIKKALKEVRCVQHQDTTVVAGMYCVEGSPAANIPQQLSVGGSYMYTRPSFVNARVAPSIVDTCSPSYGSVEDCNTVSISILFNLALAHHMGAILHQEHQAGSNCSGSSSERDTCLYKAKHFYESTYKLLSKTNNTQDLDCHQDEDATSSIPHECTRYMSILNNLALCNLWLNRVDDCDHCWQQLLSFVLYVQQAFDVYKNTENDETNIVSSSSLSKFMDNVVTRLVLTCSNTAPAA